MGPFSADSLIFAIAGYLFFKRVASIKGILLFIYVIFVKVHKFYFRY